MADTRHKNANWQLPAGRLESWEQVLAALLMDIRDELQAIDRQLRCYRIPRALDAVARIDKRMQASGMLVAPKRRTKRK